MKTLRFGIWVLCAASIVAADEPQVGQSNRSDASRTPPEARMPRIGRPLSQPVTSAEWEEIQSWMARHSPHRLQSLRTFQARRDSRFETARQLVAERYRQLNRLNGFPALQSALVDEVEAQDDIFGATLELKDAHRRNDPRAEPVARQKLRAGVAHLFKAQLQEKEARLARLQEQIRNQKANQDRLIESWYEKTVLRATGQRIGGATRESSEDDVIE